MKVLQVKSWPTVRHIGQFVIVLIVCAINDLNNEAGDYSPCTLATVHWTWAVQQGIVQ